MGSGIGKKEGEKNPVWNNYIIYAINTYHFPHSYGQIEGDFPSKWIPSCFPIKDN